MAVSALDLAVGTLDDELGALALRLRSGPSLGVALAVEDPRWPGRVVFLNRPASIRSGFNGDVWLPRHAGRLTQMWPHKHGLSQLSGPPRSG